MPSITSKVIYQVFLEKIEICDHAKDDLQSRSSPVYRYYYVNSMEALEANRHYI
jgi:hypothetical protein